MTEFVQSITPVVHVDGLRFARSVIVPSWNIAGVRALSTLRGPCGVSLPPHDRFNMGARCGDAPAALAANRSELQVLAGLPGAPRWLQQVHGREVIRFDSPRHTPDADGEPQADAAITGQPNVVLAILHADCLPVLFAASDGSEVAAAHAGWRGLAGGVLEATVVGLRNEASVVHAWLGPCAGAQAYEVGDEVRQAFVDQDSASAAHFSSTRPHHWLCDLPALARRRLRAVGIAHISGGEYCTISQPQRFFSHRRDGRSGRMASLIWREPTR